MTLNQLLSFVTVAQYSSFTEAAKHLHIVQAAVSHNVATLERELNVKLLLRKQHITRLTQAGKMLLEDAKKILDLSTVAQRRIATISDGLAGILIVGVAFTHSMMPYMNEIALFVQNYPDIKVRFHKFHINTVHQELMDNVVDIAFIHQIDVSDQRNFAWQFLFRERYKIAVSDKHRLSHRGRINLREVSDEKWIYVARQYSPSHFDNIIRICSNAGFSPQVIDETSSVSMILMMVKIGMGISIIPSTWADYFTENGICYLDIEDEQAYREQGLAWNKSNPNASIRTFLDFICKKETAAAPF